MASAWCSRCSRVHTDVCPRASKEQPVAVAANEVLVYGASTEQPVVVIYAIDISGSMGHNDAVRWQTLLATLRALRDFSFGDNVEIYVVLYGPDNPPTFAHFSVVPDLLIQANCPFTRQRIPLDLFVEFASNKTAAEFVSGNSTYPFGLEESLQGFSKVDVIVIFGDGQLSLTGVSSGGSQQQCAKWTSIMTNAPQGMFCLFDIFRGGQMDSTIRDVSSHVAMTAVQPPSGMCTAEVFVMDSRDPLRLVEIGSVASHLRRLIDTARSTPANVTSRSHVALGGAFLHRKAAPAQVKSAVDILKRNAADGDTMAQDISGRVCDYLVKMGERCKEFNLTMQSSILPCFADLMPTITKLATDLRTDKSNSAARMQTAATAAKEAMVATVASATSKFKIQLRTVGQNSKLHLLNIDPVISRVEASQLVEFEVDRIETALTLASDGCASTDPWRAIFAMVLIGVGGMDVTALSRLRRFVYQQQSVLIDFLVLQRYGLFSLHPMITERFLLLPHLPHLFSARFAEKTRVFSAWRSIVRVRKLRERLDARVEECDIETTDPLLVLKSLPRGSIALASFEFDRDPAPEFPNVVPVICGRDMIRCCYPEQPANGTMYKDVDPANKSREDYLIEVMLQHDCRVVNPSTLQHFKIHGVIPADLNAPRDLETLTQAFKGGIGRAAVAINDLFHTRRSSTTAEEMVKIYRDSQPRFQTKFEFTPRPVRFTNALLDRVFQRKGLCAEFQLEDYKPLEELLRAEPMFSPSWLSILDELAKAQTAPPNIEPDLCYVCLETVAAADPCPCTKCFAKTHRGCVEMMIVHIRGATCGACRSPFRLHF